MEKKYETHQLSGRSMAQNGISKYLFKIENGFTIEFDHEFNYERRTGKKPTRAQV